MRAMQRRGRAATRIQACTRGRSAQVCCCIVCADNLAWPPRAAQYLRARIESSCAAYSPVLERVARTKICTHRQECQNMPSLGKCAARRQDISARTIQRFVRGWRGRRMVMQCKRQLCAKVIRALSVALSCAKTTSRTAALCSLYSAEGSSTWQRNGAATMENAASQQFT